MVLLFEEHLQELGLSAKEDHGGTTQTKPRLFDVDEYYAMAKAGILTEDDRVELLDGEIFEKWTNGRRRLFDVDEYYAMADAGILTEDDRVELLDGEIVFMAPIGSTHAICVGRLTNLLAGELGQRALVWVQNPVRLGSRTELQPDLMLLNWRDYSDHPEPEDVQLLIEVADTSVALDRTVKLPLYARAGIREVWIVNLPAQSVEVYSDPVGSEYGRSTVVDVDGSLTPTAFRDFSVEASQILPRS